MVKVGSYTVLPMMIMNMLMVDSYCVFFLQMCVLGYQVYIDII